MEIIGIIAEYNPFHNGHLYHIDKIKQLYPDSLLILVLNGHFLQRGQISFQTKEDKTILALSNKIDLVLELPALYGTQSADIFAENSLKILNEFKINRLIFGSEINNDFLIEKIANKQLEQGFDEELRKNIKTGINYPTALAKTLNLQFNYTPNDLLAISYAKAIYKNHYNIKIESIKRTNDYHDIDSKENIVSASNIRNKIKLKEDISDTLPKSSEKKIIKVNHYLLFKLLKYKIITENNLDKYLDVDEGLDYSLKKNIHSCLSWEELVKKVKSKRYTYNKINRMLVHILLDIKKIDAKESLSYINILGFNKSGKAYLNKIKKDIKIPLKKDFNSTQYKTELKSSYIYDLVNDTNTFEFEKKNRPIFFD